MVYALPELIFLINFWAILILITLDVQILEDQQPVLCSSLTEALFLGKAEFKNPLPVLLRKLSTMQLATRPEKQYG